MNKPTSVVPPGYLRHPDQGVHAALIEDCARRARLERYYRLRLAEYAKACTMTTYGRDAYAGCACPLVAIGLKRPWFPSGAQWFVSANGRAVKGSGEFARMYDIGMARLVGIHGPATIGIPRTVAA